MLFKHAISLGYYCNIATDLERLGLRSHSSPFDWLITGDFAQVILQINNGFTDFLKYECLYQYTGNPSYYANILNGFQFYHDFDGYDDLKGQYAKVAEKYKRRIDWFYGSIRSPTLFLRCITNQSEVDYIESQQQFIYDSLKRFNLENDIVFIADETITTSTIPVYKVEKIDDTMMPSESNAQLGALLLSDVFDERRRQDNIRNYDERKAMRQVTQKQDAGYMNRIIKRLFFKDRQSPPPQRKEYKHNKVFEDSNTFYEL